MLDMPRDPPPPLGPASAVAATARPITTAAALRIHRRIVDSFAASQRLLLFPDSGSLVPKTPCLNAVAMPPSACLPGGRRANWHTAMSCGKQWLGQRQ